jgi:predicted enzyme related to lactoylglutathione lyase
MNPLLSSLHHVAIVVKDVKRAETFYENVFGLETTERVNPGANLRRGKWYLIGNVQLHLQEREAGAPKSDQHFAVVTNNLGEIVRRVKQAGGTIVESSTMEGFSQRCFVFDIDGNRIEVLEKT